MENPYIDYYMKQAGSGITGYAGTRYHVGNGFFGKILKNLKPALKYIGRQGWDALKTIGSDVMSGTSLSEAGRRSLLKTAQNVVSDASTKLDEFKKRTQRGSGVKKRKVKKAVKKLKKKTTTKKAAKKAVKKVYKRANKPTKKKRASKKKIKIDNFF